jgi:hypothetical protein
MEKDNNEGRSIIKGSGFLRVDWGDEKNGSVLLDVSSKIYPPIQKVQKIS